MVAASEINRRNVLQSRFLQARGWIDELRSLDVIAGQVGATLLFANRGARPSGSIRCVCLFVVFAFSAVVIGLAVVLVIARLEETKRRQ